MLPFVNMANSATGNHMGRMNNVIGNRSAHDRQGFVKVAMGAMGGNLRELYGLDPVFLEGVMRDQKTHLAGSTQGVAIDYPAQVMACDTEFGKLGFQGFERLRCGWQRDEHQRHRCQDGS